MIGVIIFGYGRVASEYLHEIRRVIGPVPRCMALDVAPLGNKAHARKSLANAIRQFDEGDGVIVLIEGFGTDADEIPTSLRSTKVAIVSGLNMPMAMALRHPPEDVTLREYASFLAAAGRDSIFVARELIQGEAPLASTMGPKEVAENIDRLEVCIADLLRLQDSIRLARAATDSHGQIGHNQSSDELVTGAETLEESILASQVIASEIAQPQLRPSVLKLCLAILRRLQKALKSIGRWAAKKGDVFFENAAASAGKAAGPLIVIAALAAALDDHVAAIVALIQNLLSS